MKVDVTLVLHVQLEVGDIEDTDQLKWQLEENYCLDNVVEQVHASLKEDECNECSNGRLIVGLLDLEELKKVPKKTS